MKTKAPMKNKKRQTPESGSIHFSVIIPLYNKESTVARALKSVFCQTVRNFEVIVINDGSDDNGPGVAASFKDSRIRIINQKNQGVSAARNRGIVEAKQELIAFLDADDEWLPEFLETIIELCQEFPDCNVFGTKYFFCSPGGQRKEAIVKGLPAGYKEGKLTDYFNIASKSDPPLWTSAIAVKKKAITAIGGFPVGIVSGEDLLTWARLSVKFQIAYSAKPGAIHYYPQTIAERPERVPAYPDMVSKSLNELLDVCAPESKRGLKRYISLWHRMRAVIFLQCADRDSALKELMIAIKLALSGHLFVLSIVAFFPIQLSRPLVIFIKRWRSET